MESVVVVETQVECLVLLAPCRSYSQFCIEGKGTHDTCLVDTSTLSQLPLFRLPAYCTDVIGWFWKPERLAVSAEISAIGNSLDVI